MKDQFKPEHVTIDIPRSENLLRPCGQDDTITFVDFLTEAVKKEIDTQMGKRVFELEKAIRMAYETHQKIVIIDGFEFDVVKLVNALDNPRHIIHSFKED